MLAGLLPGLAFAALAMPDTIGASVRDPGRVGLGDWRVADRHVLPSRERAAGDLGVDGDAAPSTRPADEYPLRLIDLPVPAAIWMFGSGLGALALMKRRRRDAATLPPHPMAASFHELAVVLMEQTNVAPGRQFGMACIKLGKRPFIALDETGHPGIAFRVGEQRANELLGEMPQLDHWNPKRERQPKLSWVVCNVNNGELLVHLAAVAYEQAQTRPGPDEEAASSAPALECA